MDNVCHTLVGAAFAEAGLKRRTRFGAAALMIAANVPDVDVLVFATSIPSVSFRRGWTHGILAQALWPVALTAILVAVARLRRPDHSRQSTHGEDGVPLSIPWLLALCAIGVLSHVVLDFMNNYGVRLLAPFDWRWFYGDALFIVDPWLWAALGAGVWLSRRTGRSAPASGALLFTLCYVAIMISSARAARTAVSQTWADIHHEPPRALMVGPLPILPFDRQVIVDAGTHYQTGRFSWRTGIVEFSPDLVEKNEQAPGVSQAARTDPVRGFLVWSRFPYWETQPSATGVTTTVRDMRFGDRFRASATAR